MGWAGNGNVCGPDTDIDGYPDQALPCMDNNKHCKQVQDQRLEGAEKGRLAPQNSPMRFLLDLRTTAF